MLPSAQTTNVIRYTALGVGIFYGFYHQRKLQSREKIRQAENEYHRKEKLIMQAKAEWVKKNQPKTSDSLITDPNDSRFDLEVYLQQFADDQKARS